jgi:orotidine-5'-phosphate decarboxylase
MSKKRLTVEEAAVRIIVPLDFKTLDALDAMIAPIYGSVQFIKVGKEVFKNIGAPQVLQHLLDKWPKVKVFFDDKDTDISNTLAQSTAAVMQFSNVGMINVAVPSSSYKAIGAVVEAARRNTAFVMGYGIPTDMPRDEAERLFNRPYDEIIAEVLAKRSVEAGCNGIICSPSDIVHIPQELSGKLLKVTPGVRPLWSVNNDQDAEKIMTPAKAFLAGSDYYVIGRPITAPPRRNRLHTCTSI